MPLRSFTSGIKGLNGCLAKQRRPPARLHAVAAASSVGCAQSELSLTPGDFPLNTFD